MQTTQHTFEMAVEALRSRGLRMTPQRLDLLRILIEAYEPLTALEIHPLLQQRHPQVSVDTVYRNLFMLTTSGLVSQINLQNRESARFEFQGGRQHHHHAVCLSCGTAICMDRCPTTYLDTLVPEAAEFKPVNHVFEVYGYCSRCQ